MPFMWALWLCRSAQTSAAVTLVGTGVLRLLAFRTGLDPKVAGWRRLASACGTAWLVAGTLQLGLTAAEMSAQPIQLALCDGTLRQVICGTRFGTVWQLRMIILGGWFGLARVAAWRRRSGRPVSIALEVAGLLAAIVLLGSLVLAGHAQASAKSVWLLPAAVVHAVTAGVWPGGLLPLALLLARTRRDPSLIPAAVAVTRRFSRLSVVAVGVLAASGALNGIGMIGAWSALWTTSYGRVVLCKGALFALMIGVGAVNRRLVQSPASGDVAMIVRQLWRHVAAECVLAVGVLLATEVLGTTAPPMPAG